MSDWFELSLWREKLPLGRSWNKITKREWKPPKDFYTKWAQELGLGYSPLTPAIYIVSLNMRDFASLGLWPFPDAIFYLFVGKLVENYWGKTGGGSRQLRMLTWFSVVWNLFQFLGIIDYFLGKKHRVYHALLYFRQTCKILQARDCDLFPTIFNFFVGEPLENNWGKTGRVLVS